MSQFDEFYKKYNPIKNTLVADAPFDGCMFETYGAEIEEVLKYARDESNKQRVWTILDNNGLMYVVAGYYLINRMGYIITQENWESNEEEYLMDDLGDETYYFTKSDFETDEQWYDLVQKQNELPRFHDLFYGEQYKPKFVDLFDEDADIELVHTNISVSNKDTLEILLDSMRLTDTLTKKILDSVSSRFFKVIGIEGGVKIQNYSSFEDLDSDTINDTIEVKFSDYE